MSTIVVKFGGTSVGSIDKIKSVAKRVISEKEKGNDVVVVVSAMGKTTDLLVNLSKQISDNPNKRDLDMLLSTGEQVSISLLSMAFQEYGYDTISFTGLQAGIRTEGSHTKSKIVDIDIEKIKSYLGEGKIVIVAGFQGVNENGDITTLGRGGSDTTAVALAAKLECGCTIYTDVEGIYTVDPRLFPNARKLDVISYEEMMEMASQGAGVMETRAVRIGCKYNVPIYVALSSEDRKGTYIKEYQKSMEENVVTGIAINDDVLMVTIANIVAEPINVAMIVEKLTNENINIDMMSQSAVQNGCVNISFAISKDDLHSINKIVDEITSTICPVEFEIESNLSKISVVGIGMKNQSNIMSKLFRILADNKIDIKQVATSEISISFMIDENEKQRVVEVLGREFNL
ncbi:aspartate kinase [Romboutsia weinsteinii]|uniref:Aspartokinase n=1 Tax=Romboutsia weinsteinii TaxID=2020949 RepID=A0A371J3V5_9FIRM|nr:aspartate kinase [Romboutsia weinsteinii]RDY27471.1 aspartate kinase [Romboutsia weinsteinii]